MMIDAVTRFAVKIDAGNSGIPVISGDDLISNVLNLIYFFFAIAAVISIVFSGIMYSLSNGDSAKVKQAKDGVLYGVVGLIISLFAFVITGFIVGKFSI